MDPGLAHLYSHLVQMEPRLDSEQVSYQEIAEESVEES